MVAALLLALVWLPALAPATAPGRWAIDPARSQVQFSVRKFWIIPVRGSFPSVAGSLRRVDAAAGGDLVEVGAAVAVGDLRMHDRGERAHALGPGFFDAQRYPSISFDSEPFPIGELASGGPLRGMLALHGERRAVTLTLAPSACPRQPLACVIRVTGPISRSAFGMRGVRGVVSDTVRLDLRINLEAAAASQ